MPVKNHVGVVDEPVRRGGEDLLGIELYSKSINKFIERTLTPITIGIQGEWGSGKTSLINSVFHHFSETRDVKQVWVNAWEFSLLSSPEETLLKIINEILITLISEADGKRADAIKEGASKIFSGALRVATAAALGSSAASVAGEILSSKGKTATVADLRRQLEEILGDFKSKGKYQKYIIYIDDLDRIEPSTAVSILELLKNIFSLPDCVFILAIDYQVVVKGLEKKFGKQRPGNEWEFRAFFDKLIQLPFSMPIAQYDIGHYVNNLLIEIGYADNGELDKDKVKKIVENTIGGNPRSIKRLANSVSLIKIFSEIKSEMSKPDDKEEEFIDQGSFKLLLFSIVCVQIAFPYLYALLASRPNFLEWNDDFSFGFTGGKEEKITAFQGDFELLKKTEFGDEPWEQALYKILYLNPRLKPRFEDIRRLLGLISELISSSSTEENLGRVLSRALEQTSVTTIISDNDVRTSQSVSDGWENNETVEDKIRVMMSRREGLSKESIRAYEKVLNFIEDEVRLAPELFHSRLRQAVTMYSVKKNRGQDQLIYIKEPNNSGGFNLWVRNTSGIEKILNDIRVKYLSVGDDVSFVDEGRNHGSLWLKPALLQKLGMETYEELLMMVVTRVVSLEKGSGK